MRADVQVRVPTAGADAVAGAGALNSLHVVGCRSHGAALALRNAAFRRAAATPPASHPSCSHVLTSHLVSSSTPRRAGHLQAHAARQAGHDVQRHPLLRDPPSLQEVHARRACAPGAGRWPLGTACTACAACAAACRLLGACSLGAARVAAPGCRGACSPGMWAPAALRARLQQRTVVRTCAPARQQTQPQTCWRHCITAPAQAAPAHGAALRHAARWAAQLPAKTHRQAGGGMPAWRRQACWPGFAALQWPGGPAAAAPPAAAPQPAHARVHAPGRPAPGCAPGTRQEAQVHCTCPCQPAAAPDMAPGAWSRRRAPATPPPPASPPPHACAPLPRAPPPVPRRRCGPPWPPPTPTRACVTNPSPMCSPWRFTWTTRPS